MGPLKTYRNKVAHAQSINDYEPEYMRRRAAEVAKDLVIAFVVEEGDSNEGFTQKPEPGDYGIPTKWDPNSYHVGRKAFFEDTYEEVPAEPATEPAPVQP